MSIYILLTEINTTTTQISFSSPITKTKWLNDFDTKTNIKTIIKFRKQFVNLILEAFKRDYKYFSQFYVHSRIVCICSEMACLDNVAILLLLLFIL